MKSATNSRVYRRDRAIVINVEVKLEIMRVVHSSHGKFHHHDLSRQLYQRGVLERYFTGYPRWKLKREDLPQHRITTFPWIETPYMALLKTSLLRGALEREATWWLMRSFDRYVASHMPECDAFIGLSGAGLRSGRTVQQRGGIYVCDRGSAHIVTQDELMREEYLRHRVDFTGVDPRVVEQERAEYAQADVVLVPSEFARQSFLAQGIPSNKIVKIPYGVHLNRFQKVCEPSSSQFDVVFVGNISFRKGVLYLLKAFSEFQHSGKRLTIVGAMSKEMRAYLSSYEIPSNTVFTGHVPQAQLKEILSRSHVMVLPSIEDGFGLVMGQALACGCPVIASEHTGARDLFEHGEQGFIVPIRSARAIRECFQRLVDDPGLRERMSVAARTLACERLDGWNAYGEHLIYKLAQRLKGHSSRHAASSL